MQLPTLFPTALFVRQQSIVVNFESLRLLIFKDHVRACADCEQARLTTVPPAMPPYFQLA